ncbi:MAG: ATP-binding cassette domain-containing protein [Magnetococcales bacterium]|nr:ATP-binding cassette domain-containing protein [Magnetococcales bacterium]
MTDTETGIPAVGAALRTDPLSANTHGWARLTLFSVVKPYLAELLLISLMINLLSLGLPLVLLQIYDRVLRFAAFSTLEWLLVGLFVVTLLESLLRMGRSYISGWIGARFEHGASCAAMERLLTLPFSLFAQSGAGVHLERLQAIQTLKEFYAGQAALVVLELPFALLFLLLVYHLAGLLVWVPILLLVLFVLFAWYFQVRICQKSREGYENEEKRSDFMIETLNGIHSVKAFSLEAFMARRHEGLVVAAAGTAQEIGLHGADAQNIGLFFSQLASIAVVTFGSILVIDQQLTIGGLVACSMLSGRALQPLQMAVGIWAKFQSIRIAREHVIRLFAPVGSGETVQEQEGATVADGEGRIVLEQVVFCGADNKNILNGLSLDVAPGETVGIIGANGSGKTLLMELILGFVAPTSGAVRVDGVAPTRQRPADLTYLPQEGVLFRGTILENLHTFREEYRAAAMASARRLGLEPFILSQPKGYDTLVEEGSNESIPRGIKQRIVIARALVTPPRFVLFDEANMAIDGNGDELVRQILQDLRGQATLIIVSHRPSLLRLADRVFELHQGRLTPLQRTPDSSLSRNTTPPALVAPASPAGA